MKSALVISERDNVATALEPLEAGRSISVAGVELAVCEAVPAGHKIALFGIAAGQPVIKYGSPIGLATADIKGGTHVHTHNVASSRGRGDLDAIPRQSEPRLAEPPDEAAGESGEDGPAGGDPAVRGGASL